jgi:phosphatidylserine/phosphatidylglycerophosphate/cardiolipin synthase-like enzyme
MFQWSILRVRLADKIWALDHQGCKVTIMFDPTHLDPGVLRSLTKPGGRYGGPTLVPAATDEDENGIADQMIHDKYVLIDGSYAGDTSARIVFTGSANWTYNALHYNDEFLLRIWDGTVFAAFRKHWDRVRAFAKDSIGPATGLRPAPGRIRSRPVQSSVEFLLPSDSERGGD